MGSRMERVRRMAGVLLGVGLLGVAQLGLLLRWTLRDSNLRLAPLFYGTPAPAIILFSLAGAILLRRWRAARMVGGLGVVLGMACWIPSYARGSDREPVPGDLEVWFWNMGRPLKPDLKFAEEIARERPDVVALVETRVAWAGRKEVKTTGLDGWEAILPDYQIVRHRLGSACLVRGEILSSELEAWRFGSRCARLELRVDGREFHLSLADICAQPDLERGTPLRSVLKGVPGGGDVVVVGDFNTPLNSVHFDPYRENLAHAFEVAGRGFGETWPMRIPLLWIDHVWCGSGFEPVRVVKSYRGFRDHALLRCWLRPQGGGR